MDYWMRDGRWWHVLIVGVAVVNAIIAAVSAAASTGVQRIEATVAAALLTAIVPVWLAFGVRSIESPVRGRVLLACLVLLGGGALVLVPWVAFIQMMIYPLLWRVIGSLRGSVVASAAVAGGLGLASISYNGPAYLGSVVPGQLFSFVLSCGIGLALSIAWTVADERRRLLDELTESQGQVRELSRLSGASLERERISRDIHDTLAQTLAGLAMLAERSAGELRGMRGGVIDRRPAAIGTGAPGGDLLRAQEERADLIASLARDALSEARGLIAENAPVRADDEATLTFTAALERLAARFERESGVTAATRIELPSAALGREDEVVLLRCAQEALSNARRHAHASNVEVRVAFDAAAGLVELRVTDDGRGFDPAGAAMTGYGLSGLRERAAALGGTVRVASEAGRGTIVTVRIPAKEVPDAGR